MPGPGTEKHYAGRYICQNDYSKCKCVVYRNGEWIPCPISGKCKRSKYNKGQLEYFWPMGKYGKMLIKSTPDWTNEHRRRLHDAKNVFAKEKMREYFSKYRRKNKGKIEQIKKKYYDKKKLEIEETREKETGVEDRRLTTNLYGEGARHILFPCGEDCRNCPLQDGPISCPYTDEDEDKLMELEYGE